MTLPNSIRRLAAILTLLSLLFMQLAMASYVCPVMPSVMARDADQTSMHMPCHQADHGQPGLCHAHASDIGNKLSLDKPDAPTVHAFLPVLMAQTIAESVIIPVNGNRRDRSDVALRSTAPPAILLHCCFRI